MYPKITLGHSYIKDVLKLQFPQVYARTQEQNSREEERRNQKQLKLIAKYGRIKKEYDEHQIEIITTLKQMDICFSLIIPDLTTQNQDNWKSMDDEEIFQNTSSEELIIDLNEVFNDLKTKENEEVFEILKEHLGEITNFYEPMLKEWLRVCTEVKVEETEKKRLDRILKHSLSLKSKISTCKEKCKDLKIEPKTNKRKYIDSQDQNKKVKI